MDNIILKTITTKGNFVVYKFTVSEKIKKFFNSDELWIEYDEEINNIPESILTIPFVSIMLPIMWVTDSVLWVNELDYTFYRSTFYLQQSYQNLFRNQSLLGRLVSSYLVHNNINNSDNSIVLFSGGVDAHTTYIRNKNRITRLVNIQGFYHDINEENQAADADKKDISEFANTERRYFSFIKSNFAVLINTQAYKPYAKKTGDSLWHGFQHSMAFISISIPLAYKHQCSQILIASSFTVGDSRFCASYPTTDNEFSFATNGITIHDGFDLSRQDKIKIIVDYQKQTEKPYPIRVCSFNDHNCCECEKCFRTILGLIAEGADITNFGFTFNESTLTQHWQNVIARKVGLMGLKNESLSHWPHIIKRMKENYNKLDQEQKEFVDWFLTFNFKKAQEIGRFNYYRHNFFSILKRKLHL